MRRRGLQVQNNNKPLHFQEAKDEQGRKHFYGAFTGALNERSVGFKGTVGSKEGFIPSSFISSRDQKAQIKPRDVSAYIDEEDEKELAMINTTLDADNVVLMGTQKAQLFKDRKKIIVASENEQDDILQLMPQKILGKRSQVELGNQRLPEQLLDLVSEPILNSARAKFEDVLQGLSDDEIQLDIPYKKNQVVEKVVVKETKQAEFLEPKNKIIQIKQPSKIEEAEIRQTKFTLGSGLSVLENVQKPHSCSLPLQLQRLAQAYASDKMLRFEAYYIEEVLSQMVMFRVPNQMMRGSQIKQEKEEFGQIVAQYNQKFTSGTVSQKQKESSVGRVMIEEKEWQPDRILLIRFGFNDPKKTAEFESKQLPPLRVPQQQSTGDDYFLTVAQDYNSTQIIQSNEVLISPEKSVKKQTKGIYESIFNDQPEDY